MAITLTISFHGGSGGVNNLQNCPPGTDILDTKGVQLDELRSFTLGPSGHKHLYVVNANKTLSQILRFDIPSQPGGKYTNGQTFAREHLHHPFNAVFGPDGNLYVSNQDAAKDGKIKITEYEGPSGANPGKYIKDFASGFTTLRGIYWVGNQLFATDEGDKSHPGTVTVFNSDGSVASTITAISQPVHLVYDGKYVYVGSKGTDGVWALDPKSPVSPTNPVQIISNVKDGSGIAIPGDGNLYLGQRATKEVWQYELDESSWPPVTSQPIVEESDLPDAPEFVAVLGQGVNN
jgi:hypothetical protein